VLTARCGRGRGGAWRLGLPSAAPACRRGWRRLTPRALARARGRCTESILQCSRSTRTAHYAARGDGHRDGARLLRRHSRQEKDPVMEVDDVPKFAATCSFGVPLVKTYRRPGGTAAATAPGPSAGTRPSWAEVRK